MGNMFGSIFGKKHYRILMLGLDNAGKTSILYRLRLKESITTIPTVGFNVEAVALGHVKFNVWDVGGQKVGTCLPLAWRTVIVRAGIR
ncbi:unnamed protein product [Rotaria socialis]|uniref:ADP-ribosylation factor n=1 Tax=Rotaria socialis TaxID=392032 RepID=A0A820VLJ2_9BILA|nr:unnamed protein product [Rotaria socialis]CAF4584354.1 unnamed protein product [Rotaria socialis]CAF4715214.1 unnamed protein product [Rotaria socialis]